MANIYISADLGKLSDWTAISVVDVQRVQKPYLVDVEDRFDARDSIPVYVVPHIERMQVRYRLALKRIVEIMRGPKMILKDMEVILDATGVGEAVLEMADEMELEATPIVITSGHTAHYGDGKYFVPRKEIVSALVVAVQERRIQVADLGDVTDQLKTELRNLRMKPRASGSEAIEPDKESQHDDMVLSLGMAVWRAQHEHTREMVYRDRMEEEQREVRGWDVDGW